VVTLGEDAPAAVGKYSSGGVPDETADSGRRTLSADIGRLLPYRSLVVVDVPLTGSTLLAGRHKEANDALLPTETYSAS